MLKDESKTPVLEDIVKLNVSRNLHALIHRCISGQLKKESVVTVLQELTVKCSNIP